MEGGLGWLGELREDVRRGGEEKDGGGVEEWEEGEMCG